MIKMPNPNEDLKDMYVLSTFKKNYKATFKIGGL